MFVRVPLVRQGSGNETAGCRWSRGGGDDDLPPITAICKIIHHLCFCPSQISFSFFFSFCLFGPGYVTDSQLPRRLPYLYGRCGPFPVVVTQYCCNLYCIEVSSIYRRRINVPTLSYRTRQFSLQCNVMRYTYVLRP